MLKKLLVGLISLNICFSSLAYAQYQPVEELTAEEVELYMSTIDKKAKGVPTSVKVGGAVAVLTVAYVIRKIAKDPNLSKYIVMSQDPKAYAIMMRYAEKKAVGSAAKAAVRREMVAESAAMKQWNAMQRHAGRIKQINRANYWKSVKAMQVGEWGLSNRYLARYKAGHAILNMEKPLEAYSKAGRIWAQTKKVRKLGKWGLLIGLTVYMIFGDNNKEETAISNNRAQLERQIRQVMKEDVDSIALYIYNLPEDQQQVAYGILSENPRIFNAVKQQVEEAFSAENIQATKEYYEAVQSSEYTEDLNNSIVDTLNSGSWNWDIGF